MNKLFIQATKRINPKILAMAKNYVAPGSKDVPAQPLIFTKPHSSILYKGENFILNAKSQINYEIELGVMIGKGGKDISKLNTMDHIGGYFLCLDMTDWSMLTNDRKNGFPWEIGQMFLCGQTKRINFYCMKYLGKGMDGFLPISDFIEKNEIHDPHDINLKL